jgi:hypothetical protein
VTIKDTTIITMVCLTSSLEIGKKLMGSEDGVIVSDTIGVQRTNTFLIMYISNLYISLEWQYKECGAYIYSVTAPKQNFKVAANSQNPSNS